MERPDVVRFRERVLNRYKKPVTPEVLLLLPCSARKPYSESRTHRLFRKTIKDSGAGVLVHEVIVTSPLGLVPRELELFYPAQHYDIPVTGHWYEDEKKLINDMLAEYVKNNEYQLIINHLGEDDLIFSVEAVPTAFDRPTSKDSLDQLNTKLSALKAGKKGKTWKKRSIEELDCMVRFQFGDQAEGWLDGCTIKGRYPQLRIFKGDEQMASLSPTTGLLIPTLQGGEYLAEKNVYRVNIYDFELTTNLFAVGVESASPEIRAKDEVVVARNGELVATGAAQMSAQEMIESDRGEAVNVRHRLKMPNP
jgi:archaeosine synthase